MKSFRKAFCVLLIGLVGFGAVATTISDVTARTSNGKVDIGYTITGADATNVALVVTMKESSTGRIYTQTEEGRHRITWDTAVEGLNLISSNVTAMVSLVQYGIRQTPDLPTAPDTPTEKEGFYCVIDLSGGADVTRWPVSYLSAMPSGGWTDEYKTTKLVLRRIEAGTFIMGSDQTDERHRVTLTKPFYIGVFEVTQRQWELVMGGAWPGSPPSSFYGWGDAYPAYNVSYDDIRGSSSGARWPTSAAVDASSFLGQLCARTGLDFDLPTEAQWEYACRAGTATTYYWGDTMDGAYAWFWDNSGSYLDNSGSYLDNSGSTTHPVGTRLPNGWGLYDMSGNVWEWCRDRDGTLAYGTDPEGSASDWSSGPCRVFRGGDWYERVDRCTSSYRNGVDPSIRYDGLGFRLVRVLSN